MHTSILFYWCHDNGLRWMLWDLTDDDSTLVQVIAWCCEAVSHYLSLCWPSSMAPLGHDAVLLKSGRQMRPINAPGDPEPHHRWSGWRLVNSPKFRCWHSSSIVFKLFIGCPNKNYYKIMYTHYLSSWIYKYKWDGRPNHPPWVVRMATKDFDFSKALRCVNWLRPSDVYVSICVSKINQHWFNFR